MPIACTPGDDCYIPRYFDADPSSGAADYMCGPLTDDAHYGTDFAVPSLAVMEAGVDVLAAAPGTVLAIRDGEEDRIKGAEDLAAIEGRECGNGVVVAHGDGWETQYCHLKKGSITVTEGRRVAKGTMLGQIGLSGKTNFPHVHLSVRHDGRDIDPFAPRSQASCGDDDVRPEDMLWQEPPAYSPGGLIATGFADAIPDYQTVKAGTAANDTLPAEAAALVIWGYAYTGRAGDEMVFDITGPDGPVLSETVSLEQSQPAFFRAVGRRSPEGGWPMGNYEGEVRLIRDGKIIQSRPATTRIE
ncbi:M23 family metallopeptidase [Mesobaculum littorinae]|uniref:M23 family metallopeptidase n=1 Tax=Mesobaculum littorinae TaxID=2486419 RepID=A0A438AE78_9RHOB|nr:M23 family metallopeptidase [Mesobaculum littorinae]RVV96977.1 M23 family metallopeptidase [Mesobaculum littorinae]